jgi:hypothetical protein
VLGRPRREPERVVESGQELAADVVAAVDSDHRQVGEDAPQLPTHPEPAVDRCGLGVASEHVGRDRDEAVEQSQVDLRVTEVRSHVDHHRARRGADEVVLLGVPVEEARYRLWTGQRWETLHEPVDPVCEIEPEVTCIDRGAQMRQHAALGIEVRPAVGCGRLVVLAERTEVADATLPAEAVIGHLVQVRQHTADGAPVGRRPLLGRPLRQRLGQEHRAPTDHHHARRDRCWRADRRAPPDQPEPTELSLELLVVADGACLGEHRQTLPVQQPTRVGRSLTAIDEAGEPPGTAGVVGCSVLDGCQHVRLEQGMRSHHHRLRHDLAPTCRAFPAGGSDPRTRTAVPRRSGSTRC